ncbi:MAG: hypothetical protein ACRC0O_14640, partial [Vibrio metschnikovii]
MSTSSFEAFQIEMAEVVVEMLLQFSFGHKNHKWIADNARVSRINFREGTRLEVCYCRVELDGGSAIMM